MLNFFIIKTYIKTNPKHINPMINQYALILKQADNFSIIIKYFYRFYGLVGMTNIYPLKENVLVLMDCISVKMKWNVWK